MKVLITGATGLVGKRLIRLLLEEGHEVRAFARTPAKVTELPEQNVFRWSDHEIAPAAAMAGVDAIVHLAGEPIAEGKWTPARKRRLEDSRVRGTRNLVLGLGIVDPRQRPTILISASAVGYYGDRGEEELTEESKPAGDFLGRLCQQWEAAADSAREFGVRTVLLRTGIVLAKEGGALGEMGPFRLGSGRQWMSWIHLDDLTHFIRHALLTPTVRGAYNMASPEPVRNSDFTHALVAARRYPATLPAPASALRLALGELAGALLSSQRALPARALQSGYRFRFPKLAEALQSIYGADTYLDNYHVASQFVPLPREQVFPFFSRAENLEVITPPWLNFRIDRSSTPAIAQDTVIDYRLKIHSLPVRWRTLISAWNPPASFVDDQLKGPYTKWHHVHSFTSVPGGTLLHDEVTFRVPGWLPGKLLLTPWIRRDVNTIFGFRQAKIGELWRAGRLV